MSAERDELARLAEKIPDDEVLARWPRSVSNFVEWAGLGGHQRGSALPLVMAKLLLRAARSPRGRLRPVAKLDMRHFALVRPQHVEAFTPRGHRDPWSGFGRSLDDLAHHLALALTLKIVTPSPRTAPPMMRRSTVTAARPASVARMTSMLFTARSSFGQTPLTRTPCNGSCA
jgi:hypothetical protein